MLADADEFALDYLEAWDRHKLRSVTS
ncbi:hypothetical protein CCACVL1_04802 [Corchorus capsularis]|uniref:Uncharacterized protein n=1 Tax=Corchorus capsularis TaxID=210143 RepID=A0A1R3JPG0_COCAP|nr:hypothetical protein CCACVL1_04802 [Corchorus capsularis]